MTGNLPLGFGQSCAVDDVSPIAIAHSGGSFIRTIEGSNRPAATVLPDGLIRTDGDHLRLPHP